MRHGVFLTHVKMITLNPFFGTRGQIQPALQAGRQLSAHTHMSCANSALRSTPLAFASCDSEPLMRICDRFRIAFNTAHRFFYSFSCSQHSLQQKQNEVNKITNQDNSQSDYLTESTNHEKGNVDQFVARRRVPHRHH